MCHNIIRDTLKMAMASGEVDSVRKTGVAYLGISIGMQKTSGSLPLPISEVELKES